jgi:hypothetical protein
MYQVVLTGKAGAWNAMARDAPGWSKNIYLNYKLRRTTNSIEMNVVKDLGAVIKRGQCHRKFGPDIR